MRMITAILSNGTWYSIPSYDQAFFEKLANKMGWIPQQPKDTERIYGKKTSWVDEFAGKWMDVRTTEQIVDEIHDARTVNDDIVL